MFTHQCLLLAEDPLYLLRTSPCFCSTIMDSLDSVQCHLLESICNVHLSDNAWLQASLPVKSGGLSIRSFATLAPSAFLASAAGSSDLPKAILPPSMVNSKCPVFDVATSLWMQGHATDPLAGSQRAWDTPHISAAVSHLMENADPVSRSRLLSSQQRESGAWLQAPPISALGLKMDNESIRVAVGLRLSAPLCSPHCCAQCHQHIDSSGTHGLHCRKSLGRHPRHASLNELVKRALATIEVPSVLEPVGLCRSDGKRPDGMHVHHPMEERKGTSACGM